MASGDRPLGGPEPDAQRDGPEGGPEAGHGTPEDHRLPERRQEQAVTDPPGELSLVRRQVQQRQFSRDSATELSGPRSNAGNPAPGRPKRASSRWRPKPSSPRPTPRKATRERKRRWATSMPRSRTRGRPFFRTTGSSGQTRETPRPMIMEPAIGVEPTTY